MMMVLLLLLVVGIDFHPMRIYSSIPFTFLSKDTDGNNGYFIILATTPSSAFLRIHYSICCARF